MGGHQTAGTGTNPQPDGTKPPQGIQEPPTSCPSSGTPPAKSCSRSTPGCGGELLGVRPPLRAATTATKVRAGAAGTPDTSPQATAVQRHRPPREPTAGLHRRHSRHRKETVWRWPSPEATWPGDMGALTTASRGPGPGPRPRVKQEARSSTGGRVACACEDARAAGEQPASHTRRPSLPAGAPVGVGTRTSRRPGSEAGPEGAAGKKTVAALTHTHKEGALPSRGAGSPGSGPVWAAGSRRGPRQARSSHNQASQPAPPCRGTEARTANAGVPMRPEIQSAPSTPGGARRPKTHF